MDVAAQIDNALQGHQAFKTRLLLAIKTGRVDMTPDEVARDSICQFGRWIRRLPVEDRHPDYYDQVRAAHLQFHQAAGRIVEMLRDGQTFSATIRLGATGEFEQASAELQELLLTWQASEMRQAA